MLHYIFKMEIFWNFSCFYGDNLGETEKVKYYFMIIILGYMDFNFIFLNKEKHAGSLKTRFLNKT